MAAPAIDVRVPVEKVVSPAIEIPIKEAIPDDAVEVPVVVVEKAKKPRARRKSSTSAKKKSGKKKKRSAE